jgi:hypothetical protein
VIKKRWLYFVLFCLVCMGVINYSLFNVATKTRTASFEDNPYDHGMDYQKEIDAQKNAIEVDLKVDFEKFQDNKYITKFSNNEQINKLSVRRCILELVSPSNSKEDILIDCLPNFTSASNGEVPARAGLWLIKLTVEDSDGKFYKLREKKFLE